jgi:hypothetical protein
MPGTQQTRCLLKKNNVQKRKTEHRSLDLLLSKPNQSKAFLRTVYSESCFSPYKLLYRLCDRRPMTDLPTRVKILDRSTHCRQIARDQCRVHSLWTKHPSFCSIQRACFVTIFQLRRVHKFSLAAAGRPQAASTQPIERYGFAGFRVLVRSFHASTLSLVLIHVAGITKQHMFALLLPAPAGVRAARSRSVRIGYAVRCVCQCFV